MTSILPTNLSIRHLLLETLTAFAVAAVIFCPIVGIHLNGYDFDLGHLKLALGLALGIAITRLVLALFLNTGVGARLAQHIMDRRQAPVAVAPTTRRLWAHVFVVLVLIGAVAFPFMAKKYFITVLILALIYVLLGLGLNIVVGLAGLLDLGFVAFYAIGAYTLALGHQYLGWGFWQSLPAAAALAALFGCILGFPVLRMHGDYLAITTLGFGEIIRLVLTNWVDFTGGPNGVSAPKPTLFGIEFTRRARYGGTPFHEYFGGEYNSEALYIFTYLLLLITVCIVVYINHRLKRMPVGRAWEALREDEIACRSLGLNHVLVKLSAFTLGAGIGGVAGVFFAGYQGFVNPTSFTFFESALILAVVVLGGLGSTRGVIIAALALTILPEALRQFADFRVLAFGGAMVFMMIWRPRGIIRPVRPSFSTIEANHAG